MCDAVLLQTHARPVKKLPSHRTSSIFRPGSPSRTAWRPRMLTWPALLPAALVLTPTGHVPVGKTLSQQHALEALQVDFCHLSICRIAVGPASFHVRYYTCMWRLTDLCLSLCFVCTPVTCNTYEGCCASGVGTVQHISRVDCATVLVTGYVPPAGYSSKEVQISLEVLNGTVTSPCSGTFAAAAASTIVQMR